MIDAEKRSPGMLMIPWDQLQLIPDRILDLKDTGFCEGMSKQLTHKNGDRLRFDTAWEVPDQCGHGFDCLTNWPVFLTHGEPSSLLHQTTEICDL